MVNLFYYIAVSYIPISFVGSLSRPVSLILLMFFERIFLKSNITVVKIVSMVLCIIGIVITIQPWIDPYTVGIHLNHVNGSSNSTEQVVYNDPVIGFSCVAANIGFMVAMMIYQRYKLLEVDGLILVFWGWVIGTVLSGIIMFMFEWDNLYVDWTVKNFLLASGHGFAACFFTIFNLSANKRTSSMVVQLASSLQIVFMLIGQYTVLIDINPGHYNALEIIGVMTILVGSVSVPLYAAITRRSPRSRRFSLI